MKKLNVDDLRIESFVTSNSHGLRGTVAANQTGDGCWSDYSACPTCENPCSANCTDPSGDTPHTNGCTQVQQTCGAAGTCAPGATGCGSCVGQETCDLQYGCGGTTDGIAAC